MMLALLAAALIQEPGAQDKIRERQAMSLPREIAPAVAPYLICMVQDRNARLSGVRNGDAARAAIEQLKADCRSERDGAELRAREMLNTSTVSEIDREQMITTTLTSIDHSRDNIADRLDRANAAQNENAN